MHIVKVVDIIDQKDGTCLVNLDYTPEFSKMVKEHYKKKRCSKKMITDFLIEGLQNYLEEKKQ